MASIAINNSLTTGHATYPPTTITGSQSKVFVAGIPAVVGGDPIIPHTNTVFPYDTHFGQVESSTTKVFINGSPAAQIGDKISCGDTVAQAQNKVFIT